MLALALDAALRFCAIGTCIVDGAAFGAGLLASAALRGVSELLTLVASKWIGNIGLGGNKGVVTNFHLFWVGGAVKSETQNAVWSKLLDAYHSLWCEVIQQLFGFVFGVPGDDDCFGLVQGSVSLT